MPILNHLPSELHLVTLALGAGLFLWGLRLAWRIRAVTPGRSQEIDRLILLARSLRAILFGLGLAGVAIGWMIDHRTLTLISAAIGLEELYETTLAIGMLRRASKNEHASAREIRGALPDMPTYKLGRLGAAMA